MKTLPFLALVPLSLTPVAQNNASAQEPQVLTSPAGNELSPTTILATQVSEIAYSNSLSHEAKQKRIATILGVAVTGAIAGVTDPNQIVKLAGDFAVACVKAAPGFATTISRVISSLPAVAKIEGAAANIQSSVAQALLELSQVEMAAPAPTTPKAPAIPEFGGRTSDTVVSRFR